MTTTMTTSPAIAPSTTATPAPELLLPCPYCGEQEAGIRLHLFDRHFSCESCDAEFTPVDVRALVAKWLPILNWVDNMPLPK